MDQAPPLKLLGPVYEHVPINEGAGYGVELFWFCNVSKGNKSYQVRHSSKAARQLRILFGRDALLGGLQISRLKGKIFKARIRTVARDSTNSLLHENNYYSVIDELTEIVS